MQFNTEPSTSLSAGKRRFPGTGRRTLFGQKKETGHQKSSSSEGDMPLSVSPGTSNLLEPAGQEVPQYDDSDCMFCGETHKRSKSGELWDQCREWAHVLCSGCENDEFILIFAQKNSN